MISRVILLVITLFMIFISIINIGQFPRDMWGGMGGLVFTPYFIIYLYFQLVLLTYDDEKIQLTKLRLENILMKLKSNNKIVYVKNVKYIRLKNMVYFFYTVDALIYISLIFIFYLTYSDGGSVIGLFITAILLMSLLLNIHVRSKGLFLSDLSKVQKETNKLIHEHKVNRLYNERANY